VAKLSDTQIADGLASLPGWTRTEGAIEKTFTFTSFADAVTYLVRLAFEAERVDHHPEVTVNDRRVTLSYSTQSEGGLTIKDLDGARAADRLFLLSRSHPR
jgi:4a-hydroxytetrahydrobiopterin dehydratase